MEEYPFLNQPYAFAVCRIEPENNLHLILAAFESDAPMPLVIVGNWNHSNYSTELFQKYNAVPGIHLLPSIYDPEKLNFIRSRCRYYLHGHSCGGTNPSLVEAMYLGLPVIAYDVNFNRETTENAALYFDNVTTLKRLCRETDESQRLQIGRKMKEIADRRYVWQRICKRYADLF
ncbi:MAG: glycosyltransferase [Victivallaceae bacterium]|nr:glycosyltransferase [Victivallaceae bacterium]